jgi:predicted nucleic acid-binding protein
MASNFILIDTSVLSEARKPDDARNGDVIFFLRQIPAGALAVPYAAIFELQRGAFHIGKRDPARGRAYSKWIDGLLETDIWLPPVNVGVRRLMAEMASTPALAKFWTSNKTPPAMRFGCDPEIAATAIVHDLPIASTDVSDFLEINDHFPLPGLYGPLTGKWHVAPPDGWCIGETPVPCIDDWRQMIGVVEWRGEEENLGMEDGDGETFQM